MVGADGDEFDGRVAAGQCFSHAKWDNIVLLAVHNGYVCLLLGCHVMCQCVDIVIAIPQPG